MMRDEDILTVADVAQRLQVDADTVRRLFLRGVIVICFPRKGKRVYRTVRIPESILERVIGRLTNSD
jgi:predicted site-specific integrase-resolvase